MTLRDATVIALMCEAGKSTPEITQRFCQSDNPHLGYMLIHTALQVILRYRLTLVS